MRLYYLDALKRISSFHTKKHSVQWLREQSQQLMEESRHQHGATALRTRQNARSVQQYADFIGSRKLEILEPLRLKAIHSGVTVSVAPDLHVREGAKVKLIKFNFGAAEPNDMTVKVISQSILEAANAAGHDLPGSAVLYVDLPRGVEHKAARTGSRVQREIGAACQMIAQVWDSVPPPPKRKPLAA